MTLADGGALQGLEHAVCGGGAFRSADDHGPGPTVTTGAISAANMDTDGGGEGGTGDGADGRGGGGEGGGEGRGKGGGGQQRRRRGADDVYRRWSAAGARPGGAGDDGEGRSGGARGRLFGLVDTVDIFWKPSIDAEVLSAGAAAPVLRRWRRTGDAGRDAPRNLCSAAICLAICSDLLADGSRQHPPEHKVKRSAEAGVVLVSSSPPEKENPYEPPASVPTSSHVTASPSILERRDSFSHGHGSHRSIAVASRLAVVRPSAHGAPAMAARPHRPDGPLPAGRPAVARWCYRQARVCIPPRAHDTTAAPARRTTPVSCRRRCSAMFCSGRGQKQRPEESNPTASSLGLRTPHKWAGMISWEPAGKSLGVAACVTQRESRQNPLIPSKGL